MLPFSASAPERRRRGPLLIVLAAALGASVAASPAEPFASGAHFSHLGRREGLSHFSVFDVAQDRTGYIWLATGAGLDRFDGHSLRHHRHDPARPDSISDDRVNCLLLARDGSLWAGTNGGIDRLDGVRGNFQRFVPAPQDGSGSRRNRVNALAQDADGRIWAATFAGVHVLDPATGRFVAAFGARGAGLRSDSVFAVVPDPSGGAWVGTVLGLEHVGGAVDAHRDIPLGPVSALLRSDDGALWIGTSEHGVLRLDAHAAPGTAPLAVVATADVRDLFLAPDGVLWIGTGAGLTRYDTRTRERLDFRPDATDPSSLSHENVTAVFEDRSGTLWAATWGGGVNRLDDRSTRVRRAQRRDGERGSLSHDEVMAVLEDSHGTLWVGTWGGGLNRLEPGSGGFVVDRAAPGTPGRLGNDRVTALFEDSRARLWIGTRGGGINLLDRATGRFETIPQEPDPAARVHMIHAIAEDARGVLWLGTSGGGLVRFDPSTRAFRTLRFDPADPGGIADNDGWDLLVDGRWLWIATSAGLHRMDLESERFTVYRSDPEDPSSLPHNQISSLARDHDGRLWIGTDAGLALLTTDGFRRFTERDGLLSNRVQSLIVDRQGNLWVATDVGLSRHDHRTGTFSSFGPGAGLQPDGYFPNSAAIDSRGRLYFGGLAGLTRLDPAEIRPDPPAPLAITRLMLGDEPAPPGAAAVEVAHGQSPVAFEFAALQYADPSQHRFLYRLQGLEGEWTASAPGSHQAVYHGLGPGSYTFQLRARNATGVWNQAPLAVALRVRPAWWMTWWARGAALALVVVLAAAAHALRLRRLQRRNRLLEETVAQRTAELRRLQQVERHRLGTALESIAEGIVITDPDAKIQYVNPAFERITGYQRAEVLGRNPRILQSGVHDTAYYQRMWATLSTGDVWQGAFVDRKRSGELYDAETTVAPIQEPGQELLGYVAVTRDVSDRLRAERALRDSEARLRTIFATAADGILTVAAGDLIESCNPAAAAVFGYPDPAQVVGRPVTELLPELLRGPASRPRPVPPPTASGVRETAGVRADGSRVPVDISVSEVDLGDAPLLVCIVRDAGERHRRLAVDRALEGTRRELEMARVVQERLLPAAPPQVAGLDIAGASLPAESVGGDYFDYLRLRDGSLAIVVADASGHGLGPALIMTQTRAYLHGLVDRLEGVGELLTALNGFVWANSTAERFVTMVLARIDPVRRELSYCAAGHRSYLVHTDGVVEILPATGIPLGVREQQLCTDATRVLDQGDVLVLCTDGVEEAKDEDGVELGLERLTRLLAANRHRPASEIVGVVCAAARTHARSAQQEDDVTVVAMRVT